jgi:asparagine synthase (glutamine-hydrolysing)
MLSGGLDSSSVAAIASELVAAEGRGPLDTFSVVGPDPESCVETRTIYAALALEGLNPHLVDHETLEPIRDELLRLLKSSAEPFDGSMSLISAVYLSAHRKSINVVLDGGAADVVLSSPHHTANLLRRGRLRSALREAKCEQRFWGAPPSWRKNLSRAAVAAVSPGSLRRELRRISWVIHDYLADKRSMIRPEFAKRVNLASRRARLRALGLSVGAKDKPARIQAIEHPNMAVARERYDRVASALAIEARDPFTDLRLINFCLSLPPEQLQKDGWPKFILRRAMRGRLPEAVLWRPGKEHLGWATTLGLLEELDARDENAANETIEQYVDLAKVRPAARCPNHTEAFAERVKTVYLRHWLDSAVVRDVRR